MWCVCVCADGGGGGGGGHTLSQIIDTSLNSSPTIYQTRMYIKASELLETGSFLEQQLLPKLQERLSNRVWMSQPPLVGHVDDITCGAWSPLNSKRLATGSHDGSVRIWNLDTGEHDLLRGHSSSVLTLVWSPHDAELLISGSHDTTLIMWNISTVDWDETTQEEDAKMFHVSAHNGPVRVLAWSPANRWKYASGGDDAIVRVWDQGVAVGNPLVSSGATTSLDWHPKDEHYLASSADDNTARLWNLSTIDPPIVLQHNSTLAAVAFSVAPQDAPGERLATGTNDGGVHIWLTVDGSLVASLGNHTAGATGPRGVVDLYWDDSMTELAPFRLASISRIGEVKGWNFEDLDAVVVDTLWPLAFGTTATDPESVDLNTLPGSSYVLDKVGWSEFNSSIVSSAWVLRSSGTSVGSTWRLTRGERTGVSIHAAQNVPITSLAFESSGCPSQRIATGTEDGEVAVYSFTTSDSYQVYNHTSRYCSLLPHKCFSSAVPILRSCSPPS